MSSLARSIYAVLLAYSVDFTVFCSLRTISDRALRCTFVNRRTLVDDKKVFLLVSIHFTYIKVSVRK